MYSYRIEQAIRAATILHKDQVRLGSVPLPYVSHLFAVTMILSDYTDDEDVIIAGLLHDTLEDTDYTFTELSEDFGAVVAGYVEAITEPQETKGRPSTWLEKKEAYIAKLGKAPQEALLIAAADKIHNLRSLVDEYYDHHDRFVRDFGDNLNDRIKTYQAIANVINRNLQNDILKEFNHVFNQYKDFIAAVQESQRR